ncbi:MAG: hypothetical protein SV760_08805 [Halobacteria archaeon]|nr:hypothetical protein [Halobacteria archaeon]
MSDGIDTDLGDEKRRVVENLLDDARRNDAYGAVVVDVPEDTIEENGGVVADETDERGRKVDTTLFAGPVEEETEETISLKTPSRVGSRDDFSPKIREKLGADDVYGFRDGCLDRVELRKSEVDIYRVEETDAP